MNKKEIVSILRNEKIIQGSTPVFKPLTGGVSSDIYLVTDRDHQFVVKQALQKLRVEDDWYGDITRNKNEQRFIRFLEQIRPESIPKLLYSHKEKHFFVMEFLDDEFKNWKNELLKGIFDTDIARESAELLAEIHLCSRKNKDLKNHFNNAENFHSLRTDPYLVTTAERNPDLKALLLDEVRRLKHHREALVHGDYSPKNIMVKNNRIVLLDHEVAWYGDPAFDLAFLLNHLYLKMLYHYKSHGEVKDLTQVIWNHYFEQAGYNEPDEMKQRTTRLLLMLMLARIDGKSPVEYLEPDEQEFVRTFVKKQLSGNLFSQEAVNKNWKEKLRKTFS